MSKVSAIITSHNYARYLPQAVESALSQTAGDVEVIVVDDGSTDDTERVMAAFRESVRYVRQPNRGVAVARNHGIELATGRYVAFLDADDYWLPTKLARQVESLSNRRDCRACATAYRAIGRPFGPAPLLPKGRSGALLDSLVEIGNVVGIPSAVLCERSLFAELGGFAAELGDCADWDMWIRIAAVSDFAMVDEELVVYRLHERNMTRNVALRERDSMRVLSRALAMDALSPRLREDRRRILARNYMVLAGSYFHASSYRDFLRCAARAIALDVRRVGYPAAWPIRWLARASMRKHGAAAR